MNDINIINSTIVRPEGCEKADIGIRGGKIVSVNKPGSLTEAAEKTIDASCLYVFPGMIDTHVHIRGGILSHRESFASGTQAAASGGITTIMEMPIANPPASTPEAFDTRRKEIGEQAYVDFCMYGGAGSDNLDQIELLTSHGAAAYKTFLMPPVPGREKEFYGLCSETTEQLTEVMERVAAVGGVLCCHSELNEYVAPYAAKLMAEGRNGVKAWGESRPIEAETEAVKRVIAAAEKTGCKAVICHVSAPETVELIQQAKKRGVDIHGETCPQYILYNCENAEAAGVFARMKPPLRDEQRMRQLRRMYENGSFAMTGSDHAPYLKEEKLKNGQDIWHTFDGLPGLELSLPLLLNAVADGTLSAEAIAKATAESTAEMLGLAPKKGRIEAGADADMVLVAKNQAPVPLDTSKLFTKARGSAVLYEGIPMHYRIVRTYVRGRAVYEEGRITGEQGWGTFVSPAR